MQTFTGILFIVLGLFYVVNPKQAIKLRTQFAKKFFDMKITHSAKTVKVFQVVGALVAAVGVFILL